MISRNRVIAGMAVACCAAAYTSAETVATASGRSEVVHRVLQTCVGESTIYDTTHAATQGAEITAAANGPATSMGDLVVLAGSDRFVCEITIEVFTLASTAPFDLTMTLWSDCTTDGVGGSACGSGPGTLFPSSTVSVAGITPPGLGTIFAVAFPYPLVDLAGDADSTVAVSVNASRSDVFWRINETPAIGSLPAGEPTTSFVERCGSTAANNGCSRNFGVNNNFAMTIKAMSTPVALQSFEVE